MPYEIIENADAVQIYGACFIDELVTTKKIVVDGDLVCGFVHAPSVVVRNGSLICSNVDAGDVHADILGVHRLDRAFVAPESWRWTWLRPILEPPTLAKWTSEDSIFAVIDILSSPWIVKSPIETVIVALQKTAKRPSCGRARVLFHLAIEELKSHDALTPLGVQVIDCLLAQEDLPKNWRW